MKKGQKVKTPNGLGKIKNIEGHRTKRYGIKLDNNTFPYPIVYYFKHEIKHP